MAAAPSSLFTLCTVRRAFEEAWPEYAKAIRRFFQLPDFYLELSSATDAFWIGTSKNSLKSHVLLSGDVLVNLPVLVEAHIIKTSQLTVRRPPPFDIDEVLGYFHDEYVNVVPAPPLKSPDVVLEVKKLLDKREKAAKRAAKLDDSKRLLEKAKEAVRKENGKIFIAMDVETYENDHDCVLEVGWCLYNPNRPHDSNLWPKHFIIEENINVNNGRYVENHKFGFLYGESEVKPLAAVAACLRADLSIPGAVLVGHDLGVELDFLGTCGMGPSDVPQEQYDTAVLDLARVGKADAQKTSLSKLCAKFGVTTARAHNAGNDAYYTMAAFIGLTTL
ncbi:hypothetical protein HK104_003677 [Borealophlyctis nickersoniae]|nr:hypothetical protein HK104_003677 [Borealophlyctis nickersoniae]